MVILKQLAMWSLEILCEACLLMVYLTVLWRDQGKTPIGNDLSLLFVWTLFIFMFGSGYLLTTGIFGIIWRSPIQWVYPAIAAALFIVHVQFYATGWTASEKAPVQVGGACIVFACTFAGNWCLRRRKAMAHGRQLT